MKTAKEYLEPTRLYRLPEQFGLKMPTDKCDFNAAVKVIEQVIQDCKPKWIPVGENLPVNNNHVFLKVFDLHFGRKIDVGGYDAIYNQWDDQNGNKIEIVTHWCPMPS